MDLYNCHSFRISLTQHHFHAILTTLNAHEGVASVVQAWKNHRFEEQNVTSQHTGQLVWLVLNCETHV